MADDFPDIPGYRIIRRIGAGGMATVYLADQLGVDRKVAIKVLLDEHGEDPEAVQRFENEARTIGHLDHPHIVRVFDVGKSSTGRSYFSMPWLPHGDLTQRHDRRHPARIIAIMRALLDALAYAHRHGVVHRDVKPENVMFDAENDPLLADFGIALSNRAGIRVTRAGATVGSSGYMSPEQARGMPTDGRSDLYSVGIMLYELLTGEMPFQGPDALSVSIAHVEDPIPRLPASLGIWQLLIDRALAKSPDERYASAEAMLEDLEAIAPQVLAGASSRGSWRYALRSWQTRNRGVMVGISALILATCALWLLIYVRDRMAERQALQAAAAEVRPAGNVPDPPMLSAAQLDQLILEGNTRLSLGALVTPPGNSAGDRFARILHVYPGNPEALSGLESLFAKLQDRIDEALDDNDADTALKLYQRAQELADRAGIRQQPFWQPFVNQVRERARQSLARAARRSPDRLDALAPLAETMQLDMPDPVPASTDRTAANRSAPERPSPTSGPRVLHDAGNLTLEVVTDDAGHAFAIGRQPVSRNQYAHFVRVSGRKPAPCRTPGSFLSRFRSLNWADPGFKQTPTQTVYCVSWEDARAYLGWLSQNTGHAYHLPSRAEWRAARTSKSDTLQFDPATREWIGCRGECEQAPFINSVGAVQRDDAGSGFTHVGFRVARAVGN